MSIILIILIILVTGSFGGYINYLMPSNKKEVTKDGQTTEQIIRPWWQCLFLGIGAALLVPLFLEIAQSKLMDNIHYGWSLQQKKCDCSRQAADTVHIKMAISDTAAARRPDSTRKPDTLKAKIPVASTASVSADNCCVPIKNYFLFIAYCFMAAAAGMRFISSVMDSVLKDKQIAQQKDKIEKTQAEKEAERKAKEEAKEAAKEAEAQKQKAEEEEKKQRLAKEEAERQKKMREAQDQKDADMWEAGSIKNISGLQVRTTESTQLGGVKAGIGPVTNTEDRQKGRFGGKATVNNRRLSAEVSKLPTGMFYDFTLTVESTSAEPPLAGEVTFFLHDSFTPSVVTVPVQFGKAVFRSSAYGAFTAGAVCDDGNTLLELDLSEDQSFPKEFREK